MRISDWSSDVCSSDLARAQPQPEPGHRLREPPALGLAVGAGRAAAGGAAAGHRQDSLRPHRAAGGGRRVSQLPAAGIRREPPSRSEEHTSELQSLMRISYAVFCLKKKTTPPPTTHPT